VCSLVAGETCPQSCSLATVVTWQCVCMSQYKLKAGW
jgi:hypothetical protein